MARINDAYNRLQGAYLFSEVAGRVKIQRERDPQLDIISLGIGDVTRPLVPAVIQALHSAVDDMGRAETFHGYGPEQGYAFLRETIAEHDYKARGITTVSADDIHVSDGAKSDVGNFQELFSRDAIIAVTDPVYPVYVDSNIMAGRGGDWTGSGWNDIVYLPCTMENGFSPDLPKRVPDIIYLCYPNNPTGTVLGREQLTAWVEYARKNGSVILYDSAYEAFISDPDVPHSIYEIAGAEEVAVEFRSFSKTAGFTGLRCAYVVVPRTLTGKDGKPAALGDMWRRRQSTKYNGCPYIVQKAAAAVYTPEGKQQVRAVIADYMENAAHIVKTLSAQGLRLFGGANAPYVWTRTPEGVSSWDFFDRLLQNAGIVCTPGVGFGPSGEGYVRFTAFGSKENTIKAMERVVSAL